MIRRVALALGLVIGALVALVGVELFLLSRREFLPRDPEYRIDARVEPSESGGGEPLRLAVLGDSTVAGVGSPTEMESLAVLIAQRTADRLGRPVEVVGFGVAGARSVDMAANQLPRVGDGFDAVVMVIGSNDATHATPWFDVRRQTDAALVAARSSGAAVVLAGTPRFSGTEIIPEPLRTAVDRYAGVLSEEQRAAVAAADGTYFVDIAADASPRFNGRPDATSSDGFHPSPIGYGFWADAIAPVLVEALAAG